MTLAATAPSKLALPGHRPTFRAAFASTSKCEELLADARKQFAVHDKGTLHFEGVGDRDVYNITAPFCFDGQRLIAGRVESRETEFSTIVFFAEKEKDTWTPYFTVDDFDGLQDPCVTFIDGELVLGGVRFPVKSRTGDEKIWVMDFYRGRTLAGLRRFFRGPEKMKDVRLVQMKDGGIGVFSRPQGYIGGRGKIGFTAASSLDAVDASLIAKAPLIYGQFDDNEWGGVNEVHLLNNGLLGALGHIACFDSDGHRHYYPMAFCFDVEGRRVSDVRIIACRDMFPPGPSKRPDLVDVVFSGGLHRHDDGTATLFAGVSDAGAAWVRINDPFLGMDDATL